MNLIPVTKTRFFEVIGPRNVHPRVVQLKDPRRDPNGAQVRLVVGLAMKAPPSVDFCGYWQRSSSR